MRGGGAGVRGGAGGADVIPVPLKPSTSALALEPRLRSTRVTADGLQLAFMSSGHPTGYDNSDRVSSKADAEVYRYDASANGGAGELLCASCNPWGARPVGRDLIAGPFEFWAAAQLPSGRTTSTPPAPSLKTASASTSNQPTP